MNSLALVRRLEARGVPAADTLASACPAETALTPAGRMAAMRARLAAVKAATAAIRPALVRFYDALDEGQKVRCVSMRFLMRQSDKSGDLFLEICT